MKYAVILVLVLVAVVAAVEEQQKKVEKRSLWGSPIFPLGGIGVNPWLGGLGLGVPLPLWNLNPWGIGALGGFGGIGIL